MVTGSITFNGLTDDDIIALLELKKRHPQLTFNPTALQTVVAHAGQPPRVTYNNASFQWHAKESLNVVKEILRILTEPRP